jgi:hypothetical protein
MSENLKNIKPGTPITHEQFVTALEEKIRLEKYVEYLTKITRAYMYQEESERVQHRKKQSMIENNKPN